MGDLSDILMAGAELRYQREGWMVWLRALSATKAPIRGRNAGSGHDVKQWREGNAMALAGCRFSVAGDITWANGGYQQRHYGVTTSQAQRTDFSVYRPSSGFSLVECLPGWSGISENVAAGVSGRAAYLFDEAGKSPLVKAECSTPVITD
jgi:outer membrane scaffolding protein for murein synthesis (MipA/OmpV family)